ncbi:uncharacterized protein [Magallana gigas]|uniref:uncharacterized protein isoform X1 n=1 Tax=Magallana gigas TaxID=29159 RepID=UPI00333E5EF1
MGLAFEICIAISVMHFTDVCCLPQNFSTTKDGGYTNLTEYGIPYSGATFITFKVRACSDAYIALSSPPKKIVIELGRYNNTQSCIQVYPQGECSASASEPVLDCRKYRSFSVHWGDSQILVKKRDPTPDENIFLSLPLNYTLDDVNIGISTRCGPLGNWVFEDIPPIAISDPNEVPLIRSSSIGTIVSSSVGVFLIAGMVIFVLLSLKYCKRIDQSASSDKNTYYESEQQHRVDQVSEHRYNSLSVITHTYLELC